MWQMGRSAAAALLAVVLIAMSAPTPAAAATPALRAEVVADGLAHPWAVAFLPQGGFLITERPGRMRVVAADGRLGEPLTGLPDIDVAGQGGLLDVVLDSDFASNRLLYFCFSELGRGGNSTALARARLSTDEQSLQDVRILFSQQPKVASRLHFGCRIVERLRDGQPDGTLFLTLGERFSQRWQAQKLDNHLGKVVRVAKDGSVPDDNPFVGHTDALPEIWSFGHRNGQGAALAPDGSFWMHEHGPMGGDEINSPQAGRNYGWPQISHGRNYDGSPVADGASAQDGMAQPLHHWTPSIAPSGMAFLTSDRYGAAWHGSLFVGSLKFQSLYRLQLDGEEVVREDVLLQDVGQRIRDVRQGPDGLLYVLTDAADGQLLRLRPTAP